MSKPTWDGNYAKMIGAELDERRREMARTLINALSKTATGQTKEAQELILKAMQDNEQEAVITRLLADGKPDQALNLVLNQQRQRLSGGNGKR